MSELATLRRLRATNSKLMKGNLALLTAIRKTDCAIEDDWRELQACCARLERHGLHVPASCLALTGAADATSSQQEEDAQDLVDEVMVDDTNEPAKDEETKKPSAHPKSSVLSVRSVLNAESSSSASDDHGDNEGERSDETRDSASDHGSTEEP